MYTNVDEFSENLCSTIEHEQTNAIHSAEYNFNHFPIYINDSIFKGFCAQFKKSHSIRKNAPVFARYFERNFKLMHYSIKLYPISKLILIAVLLILEIENTMISLKHAHYSSTNISIITDFLQNNIELNQKFSFTTFDLRETI